MRAAQKVRRARLRAPPGGRRLPLQTACQRPPGSRFRVECPSCIKLDTEPWQFVKHKIKTVSSGRQISFSSMQTTSRASSAAGWAAIAVLFAATTCVESMSWNQLSAYTPLYLRELHVPAAQVPGWIAAMSSLGWILALPLAPFGGVFSDRYIRKLVIVRSAAIEALIFGGWALSTSPWMVLAFRSLNGFVLGNTGVMLAVQASTTPRQRLALAVGIVGAGSPAGRAVGPILGAFLVHFVDVRGMLLVDSALSVLMAALLMIVMRDTDHVRPVDLRVLSLLRGALDEIVSKPLVWRLFLATAITQVGLWTILP